MKPNALLVVQAARADIIARGIDVNATECNRFAVTQLAAWRLSHFDPQVGLLAKPLGNNCEGYAVDILCWRDGTIVDILGAGPDGPCTALWQENPTAVDPTRWRKPVPPAVDEQLQPVITASSPTTPPDLARIYDRLALAERTLQTIMDEFPSLVDDVNRLQRRRYTGKLGPFTIISVPE